MQRETLGRELPILFFLKTLIFSYVLTGAFLALLSFMLYKFHLGEKVVTIAIILIYVAATFFAGFVTGRKMGSRKFFGGRSLFPGSGIDFAGGRSGGIPLRKFFCYHPDSVCGRWNAWGHAELNLRCFPGLSSGLSSD